ncbi:survival motor neuron interacting protein 1-domain-containing protein [Tribonema minus]|uniref:Survival motor neuron interacting protein 1-domain-containing protein n=1 Tax=Tribonema minus TaxID=303371 RepID=A0A835ZAJ0_9STRA|nr:survival motor neuron interacting protein 1-domain-containing protein [Tribonema minus]
MEPVLPVYDDDFTRDEILARAKLGEPPLSAEEYLLRVRYEAEGIPDVVTADPSVTETVGSQHSASSSSAAAAAVAAAASTYIPRLEPVVTCSKSLLAADEWEREALAAFVDIRQYLVYWASQGVGSKYLVYWTSQGVGSKESGQRVEVPALKDEQGWHIYCLGCAEVAEGDETEPPLPETGEQGGTEGAEGEIEDGELELQEAQGGFEGEERVLEGEEEGGGTGGLGGAEGGGEGDESIEAEGDAPAEEARAWGLDWLERCPEGNPPSTALLLQLDQVAVIRVLTHHAGWLRWRSLSNARAAWLYALLARLEKPAPLARLEKSASAPRREKAQMIGI